MVPLRLVGLAVAVLLGISFNETSAQPEAKHFTLLILGDSLTAGYGIAQENAYPALLEKSARRDDVPLRVLNGGMSGDTSAGGLRRLNWLLRERIDIFMVALGANDGLRGLSADELRKNLSKIIEVVRARYPDVKVVVAGMEMPPNMGKEYQESFKAVFREVAHKEGALLIPFLLDGVAGDPELNLPDRMHPNEKGHEIISERLWSALKRILAPRR